MVRNDLEAELIACYHRRDWAGAFCLLEPLLRTSNGPLLGWVKYQVAVVRYTQSVEFAPVCLALTDDALTLLVRNSTDSVQALINGLAFAEYMLDQESGANYASQLQMALDSRSPDLFPWVGRMHYVLSHYYWQQGKEKRALRHVREAVKFHEEHIGPYNEHDRLCYLRRSHTSLGHALLKLSDYRGAEAAYQSALEVAPPDISQQDLFYLRAQLAKAKGRESEARQLYREAMVAARKDQAWVLAVEIFEKWALAACSAEDEAELGQLRDTLEIEAAHAENPALVLRLQRTSITPLCGEGGKAS